MKTILPLLLIISMSASAQAQVPYGIPNTGIPANYAGQPGASGINYQGIPAGFQAHPHLSPFANASEQHVNEGGLWYSDTVSHFEPRGKQYTYETQVEWLSYRVRRPRTAVGDPVAANLLQIEAFQRTDILALTAGVGLPFELSSLPRLLSNGVRLSTKIKSRDGWNVVLNASLNPTARSTYDPRGQLELIRLNEIDALLLQATGGVLNGPQPPFNNLRNTSDREITETIILGEPIVDPSSPFDDPLTLMEQDFGVRGLASEVLERTIVFHPPVSLQNGVDPDGVLQKFDIEYIAEQSIRTFGAGAHFETDTMFRRHGINFRGLVGGRYMRINEGFHFRGTDSGLDYTFTAGPEQIDRQDNDGDFIIDEIGEGAGTNTFDLINPSTIPLMRSFLNSVVQTDLAGPEIGLAYDIAKTNSVSFSGTTRAGVMFARERVSLQGDNIGSNLLVTGDPTMGPVQTAEFTDLFDTTPDPVTGLTQNAFQDSNSSKHLSPMIEQTFTATLPLFKRVPVIRDMPIFQRATLQAGYSVLWIGEIAEPEASVQWTSNPRMGLFPTVSIHRDNYYQHGFRLGFNCDY